MRSLALWPITPSHILRHVDLPREVDVAIEFWRLKECLRNDFENSRHWSDEMWKSRMAGGGTNPTKIKNPIIKNGETRE